MSFAIFSSTAPAINYVKYLCVEVINCIKYLVRVTDSHWMITDVFKFFKFYHGGRLG